MNSHYALLTIGPGSRDDAYGHCLVVKYPGFEIVDRIARKNEVFEATHKGIGGASLTSDHPEADFVGTMESEIFLAKLAPLKLLHGVTHYRLNDAHHTAYGDGQFAVANAGGDSVELFDEQLRFLETVPLIPKVQPDFSYGMSLLAEEVKRTIRRLRGSGASYRHLNEKKYFANFQKWLLPNRSIANKEDIRRQDLRPHFLHPNYVQRVGGDWVVTLFRNGEQIRLSDGRTVMSGLARPHDGVHEDGEMIFTESRTSRVTITEPSPVLTPSELSGTHAQDGGSLPKVIQSIEVIPNGKRGFVRGVARMDDHLLVGVTARRGSENMHHARLAVVDRQTGITVETWDVPKEIGTQVYSVLNVTDFYR